MDRLHDLVTATGGALEAPIGFVKDVAESLPELGTLDLPSFTHDVYHALIDRGGQLVGNTMGPEGIIGTGIGALPAGVRDEGNQILRPIEDGMDLAYHDLVGKPLATAITAGTFASEDGIGALLKPKTYAESWNIAEHRSPGQSLALAFLTKDIRDPAQVRKAQGTDWYQVISGTTDALSRTFLDPTALALGEVSSLIKGARSVEGTLDATRLFHVGGLDRLEASGAVDQFAQHVAGMVTEHGDGAAGAIRHTFFARHALGAPMADLLADAHNLPAGLTDGLSGVDAVKRVTRILAGAPDELELLRSTRADLAGRIDRLMQRQTALAEHSFNGFMLHNAPDEMANVESELSALYGDRQRLDRLSQAASGLQSLPRPGGVAAIRGRFSLGDFYQDGPFSKALNVTFAKEPHRWVHLDDPTGDIQVWRMMQQSEMTTDAQNVLRAKYAHAADPVSRLNVIAEAERASVTSIAEKAGMSYDDIRKVLAEADRQRPGAKYMLDSRAYDGEGRSVITMQGEDGVAHKMVVFDAPLYETQLPNLAPIADMDKVKDAIRPIKKFLDRNPAYQIEQQLVDNFARVWKPAVLLRVGFPLRFLTDEALRSMSKIGALSTLKNMGQGGVDGLAGVLGHVGIDVNRDLIGPTLAGHAFEGAFGAPGDGERIYKGLIRARESFGSLISQDEGRLLDQLIQSGPWRTVMPTEAAYAAAWEHAVNNQIGKSTLGARLLERMQTPTKKQLAEGVVARTPDEIVADTVNWLKTDQEGQRLAEQLPFRGKTLPDWVRAAHDQIDSYLPTDELKAAAWAGNASHADLVAHMPNAADRPLVHGGVLAEQMGGPIGKYYRKMVDTAMNNLVGKPSDYLMRNRFFDHMYQAELSRQVRLATGEAQLSLPDRIGRFLSGGHTHAAGELDVTPEMVGQMQWRARRYALGQTKDLFHDFSEEARFAKMLGQLAPFANAWGQIMGRWAGIAIDNPAFVRRLQVVWRSPERAGLVTDGAGNVLDEHGNIVTPVKGGNAKVGDAAADGERNVTLHLPAWARDIPGFKDVGNLKFGKDSLNLIVHGLPPVGPMVQVGMNEIAKSRPELEASLKWALPYGVTAHSLDILKPTLIRRLQTSSEGDANRSYAYTAMRIYTDKMVDYNLGKTKDKPTWAAAKADADAFWHMRTIASFTLPVTPQFTSPYQPYIDAYRARRDLDGKLTDQQRALPSYKTPDEWFLDTYGQEFFPLVASMSKSIDGIAPTLEGQKVHEQYGDLLAKYPELGSLISGEEGAGAFSRSVYEAQFSQKIGAGSSDAERRVQTHDEFANQTSTKMGWIEFGRFMDTLDSVLHQRGLPSYNVKAASDLLAAKHAYVEMLANDPRYAGWYDDYASFDATKWDNKIAGMTAIVGNKTAMARPEFQGLAQYLEMRKEIVGLLGQADSHTLSAQSNEALLNAWEAYRLHLVDTNPAFGALYNRWLQNDPVTITPITLQAQAGQLPTAGIA